METNEINGKNQKASILSSESESSYQKETSGEKCQNCYNNCSHRITHVLENISYKLGIVIGKYPWTTIIATLIFFAVMSCGLVKFNASTDDEFLWTPYGSDFVDQKKWITDNYPKDKRYESIIVYTKDGVSGNVLTAASIQYLNNIHKSVENLTSSDNRNLSTLCLPLKPESNHCSILSIKELFKEDEIDTLTDDDVLHRITEATSNPNSGPLISNMLGNITTSETGNVISASSYMTTWILMMPEEDSFINKGGSYVDPIAENWEATFIELLATDEGYINGGNVNTNGENIKGKPDYIQLELLAEKSFDDGINDVLQSNNIILYFGGVLLLIFIMLVLGRFNSIEQRIILSLCGMVVIGLGLGASFGFCFYAGWFFADMHPIIPFLLLGIGVDDMFVIVKSMDNLTDKEKRLPAYERVGLALKLAGVSITVTSITNMFAFLIGATSSMPIIRSFCIFCGMGIFFLYFFSVTFFVACMALDEKRIDARKIINCPCIKPKPDDWKPSRLNNIRVGQYVFGKMLPQMIFKLPMKITIVLYTLCLFGVGLYGVTQMKSEYDPVTYMDALSYQRRYFDALEKYFPDAGERVEIYIGDIEYWKFDEQLKKMQNEISNNPSVRNNSLNYWYTPFQLNCCSDPSSDCGTENGFKYQLGNFLASTSPKESCANGALYLNNMKLEYEKYPDDLKSGNFNISATRATFQHNIMPDTPSQNEAVKSIKDSLKSIQFTGQNFSSPIAYSFMYIQWEANEIMGEQLIRNLSLTFAIVIILTFIFVPNFQVSVPTLACVSFTVLDLFGFCYYLGLSVEFVTTIIIILSVGLAIDYCVHISIAYMVYTEGTRHEKAQRALAEMGGAVFNGGFSTFLAFVLLASSRSYVYKTFFEMFALVLLIGLFHGLIFLPVLLSLIGPQSSNKVIKAIDDIDGNKNVTSEYDNPAFHKMENGSTPWVVNGDNSKISQL